MPPRPGLEHAVRGNQGGNPAGATLAGDAGMRRLPQAVEVNKLVSLAVRSGFIHGHAEGFQRGAQTLNRRVEAADALFRGRLKKMDSHARNLRLSS
jgi:hypothetical protein